MQQKTPVRAGTRNRGETENHISQKKDYRNANVTPCNTGLQREAPSVGGSRSPGKDVSPLCCSPPDVDGKDFAREGEARRRIDRNRIKGAESMKFFYRVRNLDRPHVQELIVIGRDAWALDALLRAGRRGVTPLEVAGPRWSAYVFKLRALSISIETIRERHAGPFPGSHARYRFVSRLKLLPPAEGSSAAS